MKRFLALMLVLMLALALPALAASFYRFSGDCNVRSGPSLDYGVLGVAYQGSTLTALGGTQYDSRGVAWYSVSYKGKTGWVSSLYALPDGAGYISGGTCTFTGDCNVRSGPSLDYGTLGAVKKGESLPALGGVKYDDRGVAWYSVTFKGKTGWVSSVYASLNGAPTTSYSGASTGGAAWGWYIFSASTNVRTGPGTGYKKLGSVKKGSSLPSLGGTRTDSNGTKWYSVDFGDNVGWVSSAYAKFSSTPGEASYGSGGSKSNGSSAGGSYSVSGSYVYLTGKTNVRSGPSLDDDVIGKLDKGDTASFAGKASTDSRGVTWYRIYYGSGTGWVSSVYAELN